MLSQIRKIVAQYFRPITSIINPEPELTDEQRVTKWVMKNTCPDCGGNGFYEGPSGGMSQNIKCANGDCGSRFNWTGGIGLVERISGPSPDASSAHAKARNMENRPQ